MAKSKSTFVVYNLRETYHELGKYDFKIVLNPKFFKNGHPAEVQFFDSDRNKMKFKCEKWGRKINCSFVIDSTVADGVSFANLVLIDDEGTKHNERITFWVIKP